MVHGTGGVFFCGTDVCCVVVGTVFSCRILGVEDVCGELGARLLLLLRHERSVSPRQYEGSECGRSRPGLCQAISECPRLIRPADLKSEENYKILHLYISYTYWDVILYVADPVKCQPYKCVKCIRNLINSKIYL